MVPHKTEQPSHGEVSRRRRAPIRDSDHKNGGKSWTDEDVRIFSNLWKKKIADMKQKECLLQLRNKGVPYSKIERILQRSTRSLRKADHELRKNLKKHARDTEAQEGDTAVVQQQAADLSLDRPETAHDAVQAREVGLHTPLTTSGGGNERDQIMAGQLVGLSCQAKATLHAGNVIQTQSTSVDSIQAGFYTASTRSVDSTKDKRTPTEGSPKHSSQTEAILNACNSPTKSSRKDSAQSNSCAAPTTLVDHDKGNQTPVEELLGHSSQATLRVDNLEQAQPTIANSIEAHHGNIPVKADRFWTKVNYSQHTSGPYSVAPAERFLPSERYHLSPITNFQSRNEMRGMPSQRLPSFQEVFPAYLPRDRAQAYMDTEHAAALALQDYSMGRKGVA